MKDILEKITSYNLFNYLLPGVLFVIILEQSTSYSFIQEDLIIGVFVYYFFGLVISRIGSLLVEPFLKKISFVEFVDYPDFVVATKTDSKIEILSEANNMHRTFITMFFLLIIFAAYEWFSIRFPILNEISLVVFIILLLVIFLFSYKKQTDYITKRVNLIKK